MPTKDKAIWRHDYLMTIKADRFPGEGSRHQEHGMEAAS
jgi:hypothetical protein